MAEMPALAAVMYLHAMVWLWTRPCVLDRFSPTVCAKRRVGCVVYHGDESWSHPNGTICVMLGLIDPKTGDPIIAEMRRGWA